MAPPERRGVAEADNGVSATTVTPTMAPRSKQADVTDSSAEEPEDKAAADGTADSGRHKPARSGSAASTATAASDTSVDVADTTKNESPNGKRPGDSTRDKQDPKPQESKRPAASDNKPDPQDNKYAAPPPSTPWSAPRAAASFTPSTAPGSHAAPPSYAAPGTPAMAAGAAGMADAAGAAMPPTAAGFGQAGRAGQGGRSQGYGGGQGRLGQSARSAGRAARPSFTTNRQEGRSKRQAHLTVARIEPWSVMKFSFCASVVAFFVLFVAVAVLYGVLSALGVFDSLQHLVQSVTSGQSSSGTNISRWFSASRVLGYTALLGSLNIVLITAISTIGSVVYNVISHSFGGIEVTLRESD